MHNYSSAKLELLALKWAVTEKFWDYFLGSKFTVYTDNNPLAYVQTSKLGASQIRWLSELALFDFNIIYRSGKTNQATDALSWCPEPNCKLESDSDSEDQSCCHMPPCVTPLSQSLVKPRSHLTSRKRLKQWVIYWKRRRVCPSSMLNPTLQLRPVQSQFLIRCHQPLWPKPKAKILCWDWSFHTYVRGLNQRARLLQKLDVKQHINICCNLID